MEEQQKGWLLEEKKDDGFTALHLACLNNHFNAAELLVLSRHVNVNAKNFNQQTALHLAVECKHQRIIKLLLKHKCDANAENKDGDTALHCLLRNHKIAELRQMMSQEEARTGERLIVLDIGKALIQHGANLFLKNKKSQSPLDLCTDPVLNKVLNQFHKDTLKSISTFSPLISQTNVEEISQISTNLIIDNDQMRVRNDNVLDECLVCSDNKREVLFEPCGHVATCRDCGSRCKKCLVCKESILGRVELEECLVCSDRKASVKFEPCGHLCSCEVCAKLMKKCIKCRTPIDKQVSWTQLCAQSQEKAVKTVSESVSTPPLITKDIQKLQQQLQDIKEQVHKYKILSSKKTIS